MTVLVEPDDTAARIRSYVRANPGLVHDDYADAAAEDPLEGACYVLAEAFFYAHGGPGGPYEVYCLSWSDVDDVPDETDETDSTHWYLRRGDAGPWVDLGLPERADGDAIPFDVGTHRGFIGGYTPSNRCRRVLDALGIEYEAES